MKSIDELAENFVTAEANKLRLSTFAELTNNLAGAPDPRVGISEPVSVPDSLLPYQVFLTRVMLQDGAVRVLFEGYRPAVWGVVSFGVSDAFDKLPDNTVREIPPNDEDSVGRA